MSEEPLSDEELKRLRAIITADARRVWLISGLRSVGIWVAALSAGYIGLKGLLAEVLAGVAK